MPATPDFDQIATRLLVQVAKDLVQTSLAQKHVVEQLRQVWNDRGAADLAAVDDVAHTNDVPVADAIRRLDR